MSGLDTGHALEVFSIQVRKRERGFTQVHNTEFDENSNRDSVESPEQAEERQAERYNYIEPSAAQVARMDGFWLKHNPSGDPAADSAAALLIPHSQTEAAWNVLCRNKGAQVPQFELQHPDGEGIGKKWIALLNTRLHELRFRYGYSVENRTEKMSDGSMASWYWIRIGSNGLPLKDHPRSWRPSQKKTGIPKASTKPQAQASTEPPPPPPIVTDEHGQSLMFADLKPVRPAPVKTFDQLERGA